MKKHIVCFGDSNTHGFCADPADCADPQHMRFNEQERWTCLLAHALGASYLVLEEGLNGRTTAFPDPLTEGLCGLEYLTPCLRTHQPVSLLIVMLGTNDTKERFGANPACIGLGMQRLLKKAMHSECWQDKQPNILLLAPPHMKPVTEHLQVGTMGAGCVEKSRHLATPYAQIAQENGWHFLDTQTLSCEFNEVDGMHLTRAGHRTLAQALTALVPTLL